LTAWDELEIASTHLLIEHAKLPQLRDMVSVGWKSTKAVAALRQCQPQQVLPRLQ